MNSTASILNSQFSILNLSGFPFNFSFDNKGIRKFSLNEFEVAEGVHFCSIIANEHDKIRLLVFAIGRILWKLGDELCTHGFSNFFVHPKMNLDAVPFVFTIGETMVFGFFVEELADF